MHAGVNVVIADKINRIRRLARAGETERAWTLFGQIGLKDSDQQPELLSLKGRLIKDRALKSVGEDRIALLEQARDAYLDAAALRRATYPLINAATIALLMGRKEQAKQLARDTLDLLDSGDHEAETPYWLQATRAEAALLVGQSDAARLAMSSAMESAPQAWEDHASTLRHLRLVLQSLGQSATWLDSHRPPPTLHFSGLIAIADERTLAEEIGPILDEISPVGAYGALAAGADIVIAELLVQRDVALHVILPAQVATFKRTSVSCFGARWESRFEVLLDGADSVEIVRGPDSVSRASVMIADQVAMGLAVENAALLESYPIALRVTDGSTRQRLNGDSGAHDIIVHDVPAVRSADPIPAIPEFERRALVVLGGEWDIAALISAGAHVDERADHRTLLWFERPVTAVQALLADASPGDSPRVAAIDYRAVDPLQCGDCYEVARILAPLGNARNLVVSQVVAMALKLEAPDICPEKMGHVATPLGDLTFHAIAVPAK